MGQSYYAEVIVGLPRADLRDHDEELIEQLIDDGELETCPPYYDGNFDDDAIVGITYATSECYSPSTFEWKQAKIDEMKAAFLRLTGLEGKVWLSPRGY